MVKITEKGRNRRDEILTAADRLFREYGYEKVTLRMLADEVKISRGHLFHYFSKKADVMEVLLDNLISRIWRHTNKVFTSTDDPLYVYSIAHCWFFMTVITLPDLRRLLIEGIEIPSLQKYFIKQISFYFSESVKGTAYNFTGGQIYKAILAAQSAHFALIKELNILSSSENVIELSLTHIGILFYLLGLNKSSINTITDYTKNEMQKYSDTDIAGPFKHDYQWYEIERHNLEIEKEDE